MVRPDAWNVPAVRLAEQASAPATPASGFGLVYVKSDGLLYWKDDAGTEHAAGGGSVATDAIWDAAGDLAVGSGANTAAKLTQGANGTFLGVSGGALGYYTPSGGGGGVSLLLDYNAVTDIHNGTAIPNATWTNVGPSNSFTVGSGSGKVMTAVSGVVFAIPVAGTVGYGIRLVFDAAGTPIARFLCGARTAEGNNLLAGVGPVMLDGLLSAGAHTVQVQVYSASTNGGTFYCRPATNPNTEGLRVQVTEYA